MPVALVTGANGFIGRQLCNELVGHGWKVLGLCRTFPAERAAGVEWVEVGDVVTCPAELLTHACDRVDTVFHLAGRAHRVDRGRNDADSALYLRDNAESAVRLYHAAAAAHVSRFVYLSSIKVLGDVSANPLSPDAPAAPQDVYASSKHQAELELVARAAAVPVTVIRPPLVYGPGVRGNMATLLGWIDRGWPLPLGLATAKRSLVAVANLTDLIRRAAESTARCETLHVRDREEWSVRELVTAIASALGRRARLVSVPPGVVRTVAMTMGRARLYSSLFEPLRVDDSATRIALAWQPPVSAEQAIAEMGEWWRTR